VHLIRDVLDKQLLDKARVHLGRVDGIVMRVEEGRPPKIEAIELGMPALTRRLCAAIGLRWAGSNPGYRIPWSKVTDVGVDIEVDIDRKDTPLERWQEWLRQNVMRWIPGGLS
jgi:sporulation protein YlmC with PRC-barrel domain